MNEYLALFEMRVFAGKFKIMSRKGAKIAKKNGTTEGSSRVPNLDGQALTDRREGSFHLIELGMM